MWRTPWTRCATSTSSAPSSSSPICRPWSAGGPQYVPSPWHRLGAPSAASPASPSPGGSQLAKKRGAGDAKRQLCALFACSTGSTARFRAPLTAARVPRSDCGPQRSCGRAHCRHGGRRTGVAGEAAGGAGAPGGRPPPAHLKARSLPVPRGRGRCSRGSVPRLCAPSRTGTCTLTLHVSLGAGNELSARVQRRVEEEESARCVLVSPRLELEAAAMEVCEMPRFCPRSEQRGPTVP